MPLVSVITPAYNAARFIGETIASVQAQSLQDWEMIIADDCSQDDTCEIVSRFASKDPRIVLVKQDKNSGPAATRNAALQRAGGRFIAFLDSDDLWLQEKLEHQTNFMNIKDCAVSYTWYRRVSEDGKTLGRVIEAPASQTYRQALKNAAIPNLTSMVDTAKTGPIRINEAGFRAHDYILWLSLLRQGHNALCLQEDLARYRSVVGSISSPPARSAYWVWRIYRDIEKLSLPYAAWCLLHYAGHALLKRRVF
ncbi:glycosyltransferase family 2 protein [Pelagibius sp. Alg239-R121]|uniref:glycosyltransferase family 2 protein n=1 Tax=Pelagibius sp. Alg239-R121 TaxID=2993448 RepID=UPI0024A61666|nr:glycosyltransferase family 2 protein [Pelagibius sp. Alg239-R121]